MKTETEEKGNKVQMEQIENTTQINDRFKPKCYIHNIFFFLLLPGNHKCVSLKQHTFLISPLLWQEVRHTLPGSFAEGLTAVSRCRQGRGLIWRLNWGKVRSPTQLLFAAFSSFRLGPKASGFLFIYFATCWPEAALWSYSASALPYRMGSPRGEGDSSKMATEISQGAST